MNDFSSARKQINTELAFRGTNKRLKNVVERHTPQEEHAKLKIDFYCECANEACLERIPLTLTEYEQLHTRPTHFIVMKDHVSLKIEKVINAQDGLQVVEKFSL